MFKLNKTLIVPIQLSALAVNGDFCRQDARRWRMNFFQLLRHNNPEPPAFHGEIEDGFFNNTKNWGVYLHWIVPLALRKGEARPDKQTVFKPLPNRWIVLRHDPEGRHTQSWLIKSDELNPENDGGSTFAFVDKDKKTQVSKLGKSLRIEKPILLEKEESTFKKLGLLSPKSLNALGYGDVNFLAYQPLVNDVFSFHDPLPRGAKNAKDDEGTIIEVDNLHYMIAGWYSDPDEEIIPGTDTDVLKMLKTFSWTVQEAAEEQLMQLRRSLYYGRLFQVKWKTARHADAENYAGMKVAFGNNAIDAMIALIQQTDHQKSVQKETLEYLRAFQYGELPLLNEAGGRIRLEQEMRKSWFQAQSGSACWTVEQKGERTETSISDQVKELLENLNLKQAEIEQITLELKHLQKLLYDAWWQLNVQKNNRPDHAKEVIQKEIDQLQNGALAKEIGRKKAQLRELDEQLDSLKNNINEKVSEGFQLTKNTHTPYWEPHDPTLLITGITPPNPFTMDECLNCILPEPQTPKADPQITPVVKNEVFKWLFGHFEAEAQTPAKSSLWEQPWNPLFLEWEAEWFGLPYQTSVNGERFWRYHDFDYHLQLTTDEIEEQHLSKPDGHILRGRNFLTPENNFLFFRQFDELKKAAPSEKQGKLERLEEIIRDITTLKFLSHPLKDFNSQLLMHQTQLSVLPDTLKYLITDQCGKQPLTPGVLPDDFQGIRQGQFKINKLLVYDGFGQCITLVGGRGLRNERTFTPIKDPHLTPRRNHTVLRWNPNRFIELKPRLLEYARLKLDFVQADDDEKVVDIHKDVNPVCGWVIHNHLDKSLACFDNHGHFAGETRVIQGQMHRRVAGNIRNRILNEFIENIPDEKDDFDNFLNLIDETLRTVDSNTAIQEQHLAIWMGKPLALVRVCLQFDCQEPFGVSQAGLLKGSALPNYQNPVYLKEKEQAFRDFKFNIRIGSQGIRQDGLIGYFKDGKFYSVNIRRQFQSDFIQPIDDDSLVAKFTDPVYLTLLMDPGAGVFAQTGILPYTCARLPGRFVREGLEKMQVHFRFHSLLTTVQRGVNKGDPDRFTLPLPALQNGRWHWEEQQQTTDISRVFHVEDIPDETGIPENSTVIRDGKLVMTRGD